MKQSNFCIVTVGSIGTRFFVFLLLNNIEIFRDIKPPNFCLSLNKPKRLVLVDFGTCERSQATIKAVGFCGTERYASLRTHRNMVLFYFKLLKHNLLRVVNLYYVSERLRLNLKAIFSEIDLKFFIN